MSELRDQIVAMANSVKGYKASDGYEIKGAAPYRSAPDKGTCAAFRSLLGPPTKYGPWDLSQPFSCKKGADGKYITKGVSSCGLVCAGILRLCGFRLPWNGCRYYEAPSPYTGLDIVSELSLLGIRTKSRRKAGERPLPGDVVCIGTGLNTHILTVVDWEGDTMVSVDGGQVDDAEHGWLQRCKECRRVWSNVRVQWVIDSEKLYEALEGGGAAPVETWTVKDTQAALVRHGFNPGPVDGIAGPRTKAAIVAFQKANGLVPDGLVGPLTKAELVK